MYLISGNIQQFGHFPVHGPTCVVNGLGDAHSQFQIAQAETSAKIREDLLEIVCKITRTRDNSEDLGLDLLQLTPGKSHLANAWREIRAVEDGKKLGPNLRQIHHGPAVLGCRGVVE